MDHILSTTAGPPTAPLDHRTVLEGFRDLGNPAAEPADQRLACDPSFNRYSAYWLLGPTLDAVYHAGEGMNLLAPLRAQAFFGERTEALWAFLGCHFDTTNGRFRTDSSERTAGILAWYTGIGTIKALLHCDATMPLGEQGIREGLLATGRVGASYEPVQAVVELLRETYEDGAFVENPAVPLIPSLTALSTATGVLWNLFGENLRKHLGDVADCQEVERFLWGCLKTRDVGGREIAGFTVHPDVEELCVNTTSFGLRLIGRLGLSLDAGNRSRIEAFLLLAYRAGGFSSTLWEPLSLNATFFGLRALKWLQGTRWNDFIAAQMHNVSAFVQSCIAPTTGGFPFTADFSRYRENCLATRYAIQILQLAQDRRLLGDGATEGPIFRFLRSQYDEETGGFFGYPTQALAPVADDVTAWIDKFLDAKDEQLMGAVSGETAPQPPSQPGSSPVPDRIDELYAELAELANVDNSDPVLDERLVHVSGELEALLGAEVLRLRTQFSDEVEKPREAALRDLAAAKALLAQHADPAAGH